MNWLINLLTQLFGGSSSTNLVAVAETLLIEATTSLLANIAAIGVEDGARLVADAKALSSQIQAENVSGAEKMVLYLEAAKTLIGELGGDIGHTLVESVTRTLAELFHQNDAGVPPASDRTIGSTP